MTLHKEGTASILLVIVVAAALCFCGWWFFPGMHWVRGLFYLAAAFLLVTILQFFRKPNRAINANPDHLLSPCDGKVVVIEEVEETEFYNDKRIQVSIFMSPVNVHINWMPLGGIIKYFKYHPGLYLVAWHPKSSTDNERTTCVVEDEKGRSVLFRQIAGAMARRIRWFVKEEDKLEQGDEMGFIKFGSRVDLLLPLDASVTVKIGDKVKGRQSVVAELE